MRNGFTLIELLLVVVIIGILAALALPKFSDIKARAHKAAMQSDLRNLATNEVLFDADSGYYAGTVAQAGFVGSTGNVFAITADTQSFSATVSRADLPSADTCTLSYGLTSSSQVVTCAAGF